MFFHESGVVETGGKFATCIINTGGKFAAKVAATDEAP
jgi:hypothetical protein